MPTHFLLVGDEIINVKWIKSIRLGKNKATVTVANTRQLVITNPGRYEIQHDQYHHVEKGEYPESFKKIQHFYRAMA